MATERNNGKLAAKIGAGAAALTVSLVTAWEGYSPMVYALSSPHPLWARRKSTIRKSRVRCRSNAKRARRSFFFCPAAVEVSAPERPAGNAVFLGDINPRAPVCSSQSATGVSGLRGVVRPAAITRFVVSVVVDSVYGESVFVARLHSPYFEPLVIVPLFGYSYTSAVISGISGACAPRVHALPYPIESFCAIAMCSHTISDSRPRAHASARYATPTSQITAANYLFRPASAHTMPERPATFSVPGLRQYAPPTDLVAGEIDESRIFSHV